MDLLQLQYFCTIAQYENITRAAKALFVSQPNLSTSLSRLEDDLCVKLFERRRGKVSLTENGQLFLSYAERVLNELNAGIKAVQAAEQANFDQLRVVSSQLDFIGEILQKYPADRRIRIKQVKCANMDVYDRILSDNADFGFYFGTPKTRILEFIPLLTSERIAILHKDHPLAKKKHISILDLASEPLICNYCRDDAEFLSEMEQVYGLHFQILSECDDTQIEATLIGSNRGLSISPLPNYYKFKRLTPDLPIAYVSFDETLPLAQMGVVRRPGNRLTDSALFFLQKAEAFFMQDRENAIQYINKQSEQSWNVTLGAVT